jgi:hypothetical protein
MTLNGTVLEVDLHNRQTTSPVRKGDYQQPDLLDNSV